VPRDSDTTRPSAATLAYASARRAEFFTLLDSLGASRRRGFVPLEVRLLRLTLETIMKAGRFAPVVLP
jgi:hypothetical protein